VENKAVSEGSYTARP